MTQVENNLIKERVLMEFYKKFDLKPTSQQLDACHEALSDELVDKISAMVSVQQN